MVDVRDRAGRPWRAKVACAVGSSTVVVAHVVREYDTQVALADDQHAVGDFGLEGADGRTVQRNSSPADTEVESGPRGCPHRQGRRRRRLRTGLDLGLARIVLLRLRMTTQLLGYPEPPHTGLTDLRACPRPSAPRASSTPAVFPRCGRGSDPPRFRASIRLGAIQLAGRDLGVDALASRVNAIGARAATASSLPLRRGCATHPDNRATVGP